MMTTQEVLLAQKIMASVIKKRFPNLTVEETNDLAAEIIIELGDILS